MNSDTRRTVQRKLDVNWPKCPTCREPLTSADRERASAQSGRCWYCYQDAIRALWPRPSYAAPFAFDLDLLDALPEEVDLLDGAP